MEGGGRRSLNYLGGVGWWEVPDDRMDCVLGESTDSLKFHQPGLTSAHREVTADEGADRDAKKDKLSLLGQFIPPVLISESV